MYLKMTGSILVFVSAVACGFLYGEQFRIRIRRLQALRQILSLLKGEIRCCRNTLAEIFRRLAGRTEPPFDGWLLGMALEMQQQNGKSFRLLWKEWTDRVLIGCGLKEADLQFLSELGGQIGYLDAQMQEEVLEQAVGQLDAEILKLSAGLSERQRICRVLGVSVGLLIVIVLI
ncbi:MAG TPA: hypothetical protein DCZ20_05405 [Lachnospiraceae bacterium]|nr:hypothetical protein [Lachnospiraceae bacterium]